MVACGLYARSWNRFGSNYSCRACLNCCGFRCASGRRHASTGFSKAALTKRQFTILDGWADDFDNVEQSATVARAPLAETLFPVHILGAVVPPPVGVWLTLALHLHWMVNSITSSGLTSAGCLPVAAATPVPAAPPAPAPIAAPLPPPASPPMMAPAAAPPPIFTALLLVWLLPFRATGALVTALPSTEVTCKVSSPGVSRRPLGLTAMTLPRTAAPAGMVALPAVTACATLPSKVLPTLVVSELSSVLKRTGIMVPAGILAATEISANRSGSVSSWRIRLDFMSAPRPAGACSSNNHQRANGIAIRMLDTGRASTREFG